MARGEEAYQGKLLEARQSGLEGRGGFDNSQFARVGVSLRSDIRRPNCDGQSKIVLREFS